MLLPNKKGKKLYKEKTMFALVNRINLNDYQLRVDDHVMNEGEEYVITDYGCDKDTYVLKNVKTHRERCVHFKYLTPIKNTKTTFKIIAEKVYRAEIKVEVDMEKFKQTHPKYRHWSDEDILREGFFGIFDDERGYELQEENCRTIYKDGTLIFED